MVEQCYHQNVVYPQEANGLLSSLDIKTLLSNIPLLGEIFF